MILMKDIVLYNIRKERYSIDGKGVVYDKLGFRGIRPVRKMRSETVLLECEDKLYRIFSIEDLLHSTYTKEEIIEQINQSVYVYDRETEVLLFEFESLENFMQHFGYGKSQESRLDLICKGEKPQAKSGKLEKLVITYTKK